MAPNYDNPDLDLPDPAEPVYDAAQVASAIDALEMHYNGLMSHAVPAGDGRFASISFSNPAGDSGKFYGPQTQLVLQAARLWYVHIREGQCGVVPTITEPKKWVYRVLVSLEGEIMDDDYFSPYDRRKDAFIFAATLDPKTYDSVDVVEDEVPADTISCAPQIENDEVELDF
jgi:hypothetical protein